MKSEMDAMGMDEHQRLCWLRANRLLVFIIGAVWLGMIGWELWHARTPLFLIAMVPILALTRLVIYKVYVRRT